MKLQNMIRMQVVMAGVAAGLFLASAAPAQEITNTEWPDAPGATESVATAPAAVAASVDVNVEAAKPAKTQEAAVAQPVGSGSLAFLLIGIGGMAVYTVAEVKRVHRTLTAQ